MFKIQGKKTYMTAIAAVLTAIAGYLTGEVQLAAALQLGFTGAIGAFVRNGIKTDSANV